MMLICCYLALKQKVIFIHDFTIFVPCLRESRNIDKYRGVLWNLNVLTNILVIFVIKLSSHMIFKERATQEENNSMFFIWLLSPPASTSSKANFDVANFRAFFFLLFANASRRRWWLWWWVFWWTININYACMCPLKWREAENSIFLSFTLRPPSYLREEFQFSSIFFNFAFSWFSHFAAIIVTVTDMASFPT